MSVLGWIALGALLVVALAWWAYEFFQSAQRFIAPDHADRDAINAEYGEGTTEAEAALRKRFGPGDYWRDALTGLGGLLGLVWLLWIWFG